MQPTSPHWQATYQKAQAAYWRARLRAEARQIARETAPQIHHDSDGRVILRPHAHVHTLGPVDLPVPLFSMAEVDQHLARLRAWKNHTGIEVTRDEHDPETLMQFIQQFIRQYGEGPRLRDLQYGLNLSVSQAMSKRTILLNQGLIVPKGNSRILRYYPAGA